MTVYRYAGTHTGMGIETTLDTPLAEAVRKANGQSAFGRIVGRNQSTVSDWLRLDKPLPAELVLRVEAQTGVSRHRLRPDIFSTELPPSHGSVATGGSIVEGDRAALLEAGARA